MGKLKMEQNTEEMGNRVLEAFRVSDFCAGPEEYETVFEHGSWFVLCKGTGEIWAAVDAEGGKAIDGFDFEAL